ncbi:hypothetical protein N0V84_000923 [Fusarium piperis]|uniref:Uncharacterized protein n=1 Tax=Fusarium piperis TaxID=1435070 RepID=A0A9W9BT07_9HYPO|nr:hypothetical protein N0V84_000923 [Fusarium piperis]
MSVINTPRLDRLWQEAQIHAEWATTRLWEYIFNRIVFNDEEWVVSSQQPATRQEGELRRVDLVVEKMNNDATNIETILFIEAKRTNASPVDIDEAEHQAFTAACAYCIDAKVESTWAMTCIGSAARLWMFHRDAGEYLLPFVPEGQGLSARSEYLEIAVNGQAIAAGLEYIKRHSTPPDSLIAKAFPPPAHPMNPPTLGSTEAMDLDPYGQDYYESTSIPAGASGMDVGEARDPSAHDGTQPFGVDEEAEHGGFFQPQDEGFTIPMDQEETEELPHNDPSQQQDRSREIEVKVRKVRHVIGSNEFIFENRKRQEVRTTKDDWDSKKRQGRTVWVYKHGKRSVYWTKKLD